MAHDTRYECTVPADAIKPEFAAEHHERLVRIEPNGDYVFWFYEHELKEALPI